MVFITWSCKVGGTSIRAIGFVTWMGSDDLVKTFYGVLNTLHRFNENRWVLYWPFIYFLSVYTVAVFFQWEFSFLEHRIGEWDEKIEQMIPIGNIFRLIYDCVCLTAWETTCWHLLFLLELTDVLFVSYSRAWFKTLRLVFVDRSLLLEKNLSHQDLVYVDAWCWHLGVSR